MKNILKFIQENLRSEKTGRLLYSCNKKEWWESNNYQKQYNIILKQTSFLDKDVKMSLRIWHIENSILNIPICANKDCNKKTELKNTTVGYPLFCSRKCSANSEAGRELRSKNMTHLNQEDVDFQHKRKKGVEKFWDSENSIERRESLREKAKIQHQQGAFPDSLREYFKTQYVGSQHQRKQCKRMKEQNPMNKLEHREKAKDTIRKKYGVENISQSKEIREQIKKNNMKKYGVDHPMKTDHVLNRVKNTNLKKYGVCWVPQSEHFKNTAIKTNQKKYGVPWKSQQHLGKETIEKLNDSEWLLSKMQEHTPITLAEEIGIAVSNLRLYLHQHGYQFPEKSQFESSVRQYISSLAPGLLVEHARRDIISPSEIDFYIPEKNIAIECNGVYWHSEVGGQTDRLYHFNKTEECRKKGIHLIHVWETEWNTQRDLVESRLKSKLGFSDNIYARKTEARVISKEEARSFLSLNHLQGPVGSSVELGLFHEKELVAVMTFGKPRFKGDYQYELLRYCSKMGCNVIGGASKLFSYFVNNYSPSSVVSYSDRRWNTGGLYEKLQFQHINTNPPAYHYTKDYLRLENRIKYQKHKLGTLLESFDPNLSEWENMRQNGYDRVWDCGTDVFVWNSKF